MSKPFVLDTVIAGDTLLVDHLPLCDLRLMNDSTYTWLLLVPRRSGAVEIVDLDDPDRAQLMEEIAVASRILKATVPCDKLNVAALGNAVRQLHVHVIARRTNDAAWPKPIWSVRPHRPYAPGEWQALAARLKAALPVF